MKKAEIEDDYSRLQNDINELTSKINQTYAIHEKQKLQTARGAMIPKLTELRNKIDAEREANAWNDLVNGLHGRRNYIALEVSGSEIGIPENLIVEFPYRGCAHKQKLHLAEFLRHKKTMMGNQQLLNAWNSILNETSQIEGRWWCDQCREEKESIRARFFRYNDKEAGQAQWRIKHFAIKR